MKKQFEYLRDGLRYVWHGGAYIEVFEESATVPHGVINVWDYEKDVPRIEVSMRGLVDKVDETMLEEEEWCCSYCDSYSREIDEGYWR